MLLAASEKLAELNQSDDSPNSLLPGFSQIRQLSAEVALAVARQAAAEKLAQPASDEELNARLKAATWCPIYADYCDPTA
jgi:malate dehydrogenase (oxaloacetate-decarboxylating)